MTSVRKDPVPHLTYSSKPDPLLASAETICDAGGSSVMTYVRNYKKCCTGAKKGVRKNMGNSPADLKVCEEGGSAQGARAAILL